MSKETSLRLQGILFISTGILAIVFSNASFVFLKYLLIGLLTPAAILGTMTAVKRIKQHVQFIYQEIHTFSIITYVIALLLFCNSFERLISFTAFLFLFYAFSEIVFCNWLFNLEGKANLKVLLVRVLSGLFIGVAVIAILSYSGLNQNLKLVGYGIIFIITGINTFLYKPITAKNKLWFTKKVSRDYQ